MGMTTILKAAGRHRRRKRLGRGIGSGLGKTAGRGHKGAGSRSGFRRRALAEGGQMPVFRRVPKRGFSNARFRTEYSVINVGDLETKFEAGEKVSGAALVEAGLIRNTRRPVKVLGDGELTKRLIVEAARFSRSAAEKIAAAGGEAQVSQARST
ncbi:MAG: 50S ribosomal protein L15 [Phycisphaerales bacterium]|nr:MAG: 50S ribosomal protein L15 [Phycisphaerales bacterium]